MKRLNANIRARQTGQATPKSPLLAALGLAAATLLSACGGGGGGGSSADNSIDPSQLQGRWDTAADVSPAVRAIIVPDASGSASAWLLHKDASRMVKLLLRSDRSANGKSYEISQGNASGQAVTAQAAPNLTATPKSLTLTGVNTSALALSQSDAMSSAAVQADAAGTWKATLGGKAQTTEWTVAAAGTVSGHSTTGCSYAGSLTAMSSASAYKVQFDESCPDGSKTAFNGIATLETQKSLLTVAVTSADESRGNAVFFAK